MSYCLMEGPYCGDLLDQPRALQATEAALSSPPLLDSLAERLARGDRSQIILTGMGSSFHALHPLQLALIRHGRVTHLVETSELLFHQAPLLKPSSLLVIVSQSGASVEVVRLLDRIPAGLPIIAVTNTPDSPLARRAAIALTTQAGPEASVSCKTYLTALMALSWLEAILCRSDRETVRQELRRASETVSLYLADWRNHVRILAEQFEGIRDLFLVGRGPSLAAAGVGGLIIKESAHLHAEGMSSAAFRHGPFEMLNPAVFVGVFRGDALTAPLHERLGADIVKAGGRAELISETSGDGPFRLPPHPERLRPMLEMLPVEMISLALAARDGREAGKFERGSKITTVE
jgi:glucosamine--fructose-6-phosphate aminotransferase (isomerizing)